MPGVTWLFDVVWAPVSGLLLFYLYNQSSLALFGFAEEILPFTDLVPTATIAWINKYHKKNEQTFEAFAKKEKKAKRNYRAQFVILSVPKGVYNLHY